MNRRIVIGIAGPCGAGKSTLARAFRAVPGVGVVGEPIFSKLIDVPTIPDPNSGSRLQHSILRGRVQAAEEIRESIVVLDRTVAEDREIFFRLHRELGSLGESDERLLLGVARDAEAAIGEPTVLVILTATMETLRCRMESEQRPQWLTDSLQTQLQHYQRWISSLELPHVVVDTEQVTRDAFPALAQWIVESVCGGLDLAQVTSHELGLSWRSGVSDSPM